MNTRNLKSIIRKLSAFCLAFIMSFGMLISANALETNTTATITVHGGEKDNDATINAYKLIDISFDFDNQQLKEPVYTWDATVANWLKSYTVDGAEYPYASYVDDANNAVSSTFMDLSATELNSFYTTLLSSSVLSRPDKTATVTSGIATISSVSMGWYLVTATAPTGVTAHYQPMSAVLKPEISNSGSTNEYVLNSCDINLKGSVTPTINKTMDNSGDQTVSVGDTRSFIVTVDIPSYPENADYKVFSVTDTPTGLAIDTDSIKVYKTDGTTPINPDLYTKDATVSAFTLDFNQELFWEYVHENQITSLVIKYDATITDAAISATDAFGNNAVLNYNPNPYIEDDSDSDTDTTVTLYTYGMDITKMSTSSESSPSHGKLTGAEFEVYTKPSSDTSRSPMLFVKDGDNYRPLTAEERKQYDDGNQSVTVVTKLVVGDDGTFLGKLSIRGIDLGTYYIKEVKAPSGYVLPDKDFVVTLDENNAADGSLDSDVSNIEDNKIGNVNLVAPIELNGATDPNSNIADVTLYNIPSSDTSFELPSTGGMGTVIFTVGGIAVMAAAVALGIYSSRKRNA